MLRKRRKLTFFKNKLISLLYLKIAVYVNKKNYIFQHMWFTLNLQQKKNIIISINQIFFFQKKIRKKTKNIKKQIKMSKFFDQNSSSESESDSDNEVIEAAPKVTRAFQKY